LNFNYFNEELIYIGAYSKLVKTKRDKVITYDPFAMRLFY